MRQAQEKTLRSCKSSISSGSGNLLASANTSTHLDTDQPKTSISNVTNTSNNDLTNTSDENISNTSDKNISMSSNNNITTHSPPLSQLRRRSASKHTCTVVPTITMDAATGKTLKMYQCPEPGCNKAFKTPCRLRRHQTVHSGEKPFKCPFKGCTKAFSRKDNMVQHYRGHYISVPKLPSDPVAQPGQDQGHWLLSSQ